MIRGTRIIQGDEAARRRHLIDALTTFMLQSGFSQIVVPCMWEAETFKDKPGLRYEFKDRKGRDICLVPEVTAMVIEHHRLGLLKHKNVFYIAECFRYERPQLGRYRQFTQFGIEMIGGNVEDCKRMLREVLGESPAWEFKDNVTRGIDYYTQDGFEVECPKLGAQKQIAGGGQYKEGCGWAIGIDRLMLAVEIAKKGR